MYLTVSSIVNILTQHGKYGVISGTMLVYFYQPKSSLSTFS